MAAPVRTFLEENRAALPQVAFFLTDGTADHSAVFAEMSALARRTPLATLGIPRTDVDAGHYHPRVVRFADDLKERITSAAATTGSAAPRNAVGDARSTSSAA
jgi:hypothetical protein